MNGDPHMLPLLGNARVLTASRRSGTSGPEEMPALHKRQPTGDARGRIARPTRNRDSKPGQSMPLPVAGNAAGDRPVPRAIAPARARP